MKNLENIQGDERDVVILSVCYGYGPDGAMRMNFGPGSTFQGGGELDVCQWLMEEVWPMTVPGDKSVQGI